MTAIPGLMISAPSAIIGFIICLITTPAVTSSYLMGVPTHLVIWVAVSLLMLAALVVDALRFIHRHERVN